MLLCTTRSRKPTGQCTLLAAQGRRDRFCALRIDLFALSMHVAYQGYP